MGVYNQKLLLGGEGGGINAMGCTELCTRTKDMDCTWECMRFVFVAWVLEFCIVFDTLLIKKARHKSGCSSFCQTGGRGKRRRWRRMAGVVVICLCK